MGQSTEIHRLTAEAQNQYNFLRNSMRELIDNLDFPPELIAIAIKFAEGEITWSECCEKIGRFCAHVPGERVDRPSQ
jgi:hypothetical protein